MPIVVGFFAVLVGVVGIGVLLRIYRRHAPIAWVDNPTVAQQELEDPEVTNADVSVDVRDDPYVITSTSAAEMRRELNQKGVSDHDGHHDANTSWYVKWSYPGDRSSGHCGTGRIHVEVTVTYRLPLWKPPARVDPSLAEKWRLYEEHLLTHEKGHAANGIHAGEEALHELSKIGPRATCPDLDQAVNTLGRSILDKYNAEDVRYDAATRHGATQGAVFP